MYMRMVSWSRRSYLLWSLLLSPLLMTRASWALEPPRVGEIADLKQRGEYSVRRNRAEQLGNHRIDRDRLDRAMYKARRQALIQRGISSDQIPPAPPPAWRLTPTTGNVKIFALLIDFLDYPGASSAAEANSALFGDGSLIPANPFPYESLKNFYARSSYNQLNLSSGMTIGWYHAPYPRSAVEQSSGGQEALIKEAIASFDGTVDFSQFDNDGDGQIEYFIVIWTGPNNGWANFWWAYQTSWGDDSYQVDGKKLGKYVWQWEGNYGDPGKLSVGVVVHETGHALGLPDYYDYDDSVGPDGGLGGLDMMAGNWGDHNSFSKWILDWLTPTVVAAGSQTITLNPSGTSQDAVVIMPDATTSDSYRELFVAQNRYRVGNDPATDAYPVSGMYPTDGMLIWHVDGRLDVSSWDWANNNSYTDHKLLKLMQADGLDRIESFNAAADAAMYYTPGLSLGPLTNPSSRDYSGVDSGVNVTNISQSGQQMTATFRIDNPRILPSLTVLRTGNGSGTVSSVDGGIVCGSDCVESYAPPYPTVTLSAVAAPGSEFTGWSGGGCSGSGSCVISASENATVTATFATTVILDQDFGACSSDPPAGWTRELTLGAGYWWFNYATNPDNRTGGLTCYALGAPYDVGPYDIALLTPTMDLSAYSNIGLELKTEIAAGESTADIDVSIDGGGSWTNAWRKVGWFGGPQTVVTDLSALAGGRSSVRLRFRTYGTSIWWEIDDVKILASAALAPTPTPTPPPADCPPAPITGCRVPAISGNASLLFKKTVDGSRDQLQWKWSKGASTAKLAFGDPLGSTSYQLCVYDGSSNLALDAAIPAGGTCGTKPCWKEGRHGFTYKNKGGAPDGVEQLKLKEGIDAKSQIQLKGKGMLLDDPTFPLIQPITVQLVNSDGFCWQAVYSAPATINLGAPDSLFKDKAD